MALEDLPLLQLSDLTVQGSFTIAGNAFAFGGRALSYSVTGNGGAGSLYLTGSDAAAPSLGEISIPPIGGVSAVLQAATPVPNLPSDVDRIGGSLVHAGRLIANAYKWYGTGNPPLTFWRGADLTVSTLGSPQALGGVQNSAFTAGYIADVPTAWQATLGGPCLCGQGPISIIARASWGPALYTFDPGTIGVQSPAPAQPLMYFPQATPIGNAYTTVLPNTLFNLTQRIGGVVCPDATRSVLVIASMGTSQQQYGTGAATGDPFIPYQGYHAYPYAHVVLAFDAMAFAAVVSGAAEPWTVRPYGQWVLDGIGTPNERGCVRGGVAYDRANRRIYVAEGGVDGNVGGTPRIWVVDHAAPSGPPPSPPPVVTTRGLASILCG